jgi:Malectin domain
VPAGVTYNITFYLLEPWWGPIAEGGNGGGNGTRVFDILINNVVRARAVDIFRAVGFRKPYVLSVSVRPTTSSLTITTRDIADHASFRGAA